MASEIETQANSFSGARVYKTVEGGETVIVKVADAAEPLERWKQRVAILQCAAQAKLAPPVLRVDESKRAVTSRFVDGSFMPAIFNPATRAQTIVQLGQLLRRVHDLPLPESRSSASAAAFLSKNWADVEHNPAVPAFVREAVVQLLEEVAPARDYALVMSHNDVHPANIVFDGEQLMLVDWDEAGPNDPLFDLAAISLFLNFDAESCKALIAAHEGVPVEEIPARFAYNWRMVGTMCGVAFLKLGAASATDEVLTLSEFYQRMRQGAVSLASNEGRWQFGLALVQRSTEPIDP